MIGAPSRHERFTRAEWARLRGDTPLTLTEEDLARLPGLNDRVSLDEVLEIYLGQGRTGRACRAGLFPSHARHLAGSL